MYMHIYEENVSQRFFSQKTMFKIEGFVIAMGPEDKSGVLPLDLTYSESNAVL